MLVVLVAVVLVVGSYTFLPPVVNSMLAKELQVNMGLVETPDVRLSSNPPPAMLAGGFQGGQVVIPDATWGGMHADRVVIDLNPFKLAPLQSLKTGGLVTRQPLSGGVRVELSEAELTRIAKSQVQNMPIDGVALQNGKVIVESTLSALGTQVPVSVEGNLEVQDNQLVFVPEGLNAAGVRLPETLNSRLLKQVRFKFPLTDIPFKGNITGVQVTENYLTLLGEVKDFA